MTIVLKKVFFFNFRNDLFDIYVKGSFQRLFLYRSCLFTVIVLFSFPISGYEWNDKIFRICFFSKELRVGQGLT